MGDVGSWEGNEGISGNKEPVLGGAAIPDLVCSAFASVESSVSEPLVEENKMESTSRIDARATLRMLDEL